MIVSSGLKLFNLLTRLGSKKRKEKMKRKQPVVAPGEGEAEVGQNVDWTFPFLKAFLQVIMALPKMPTAADYGDGVAAYVDIVVKSKETTTWCADPTNCKALRSCAPKPESFGSRQKKMQICISL